MGAVKVFPVPDLKPLMTSRSDHGRHDASWLRRRGVDGTCAERGGLSPRVSPEAD